MSSVAENQATSLRMEKVLLFLSDGITPEISLDVFRERPLINLLLLAGTLFFLIFSFLSFLNGSVVWGFIKLLISFFFILLKVVSHRWGLPSGVNYGLLLLFYLYFAVIGTNGGPNGNDYVWVYVFPLVASFLCGPRRGTLWSLSLITIIVALTQLFSNKPFVADYSGIEIAHISGAYLLVVIFSGAIDFVLLYSFLKMQEMRGKLEETIIELQQSREELHQQAMHDGLTGVYNRRFFNQTITTWTIQAQRHESATALLMIDVDFFKRYNDRFGHLKGDSVLQIVAETIKSTLRRESDMVFRYGGEEFVVLLTKTTPQTTRKLGDAILHAIRRCNIPHPESVVGTISVSIGVAEWDPQKEIIFAEDLIQVADKALYEAKSAGRACIIFKSCDLAADDRQITTAIPVIL